MESVGSENLRILQDLIFACCCVLWMLFGYLFCCNYLQFSAGFFEILARNSTDSYEIYF